MPDYDDAGQILIQILQLQQATQQLQQNRTLINNLFNGETPFTTEEASEENVNTNVNFLEGTRIASNATSQLNRAFGAADRYFSVRVNKGTPFERQYASACITAKINRLMKRSRQYVGARESANAQVVLHGPGPLIWRNRRSVLPTTGGIEDVLIPMGTLCDMSNLDQFAIYRELTWNQLEDAAFGPTADPGWNKGYVRAFLATLYDMGFQPTMQGNRWLFPEKLAEDWKEGAWDGYASTLPKLLCWDWFYRDEDSGKWNRRMVVDYGMMCECTSLREEDEVVKNKQMLYTRDDYADDWSEIMHIYIGNCSNVAPYRYHSIRSVGYLLYGVCALMNEMRCRVSDHVFQQLLTWFRNVNEDNREKLGLIDLRNFGIMPDGVSVVPAGERHAADWNLILMAINQNRQLMAESSMAFLPDMQGALGGEGREMTATETLVRQNTSTTLTTAVLSQLGAQSLYEYNEICRRLCIKSNPDPIAKKFREDLRKEDISMEMLDFEAWEVLPEMGTGGGNKAAELTVTQALLQEVFPLVDPNGQRIILRRRYTALTDNASEAMVVVPDAPDAGAADDAQYAQIAGTVLMALQPWQDKEGVNHIVMATVLMQVAGQAIQQANQLVQQPNATDVAAQKVAGAANVLGHVEKELAIVAQSDSRKQVAKQLGKQLDQLAQALKQVGQMVMEAEQQAQQQQGGSPEEMKAAIKLQEMQASAEMTRQIAFQKEEQRRQQKQLSWSEENERRNANTQADIKRKNAATAVELENSLTKARADAQIAIMKEAAKPKPKPASK
jgi:hypothetical protein